MDELRIKIEQLIEDLENKTANRNMNDLEEGRYKTLCEVLDLIGEQTKNRFLNRNKKTEKCKVCGKVFNGEAVNIHGSYDYIKHTNFSNNIYAIFAAAKNVDKSKRFNVIVNKFFEIAEEEAPKSDHLEHLECLKHYKYIDHNLLENACVKIKKAIEDKDYDSGFRPGNIVRLVDTYWHGSLNESRKDIGKLYVIEYSYGEKFGNGRCYGGYSILDIKTGEESSWWDEECLEFVEEGSPDIINKLKEKRKE